MYQLILSVRLWHLAVSGRLSCGLRACPSRTLHRRYSVNWFGFSNHQAGAPVVVLPGLTLLKRTARSGVVSGQSSSNVIGIFLAFSSSLISSSVKASSFFISSLSSIIFTILSAPHIAEHTDLLKPMQDLLPALAQSEDGQKDHDG